VSTWIRDDQTKALIKELNGIIESFRENLENVSCEDYTEYVKASTTIQTCKDILNTIETLGD